jgi:hypothetical protein
MAVKSSTVEYLRYHFNHATPILFIGAGFSVATTSTSGLALPTGAQLARELWSLCYPSDPYEECQLQELFDVARRRHRGKLTDFLQARFCIDPASMPEYYASLLSFPWYRVYTLNVDDLPEAAARRFQLPRRPHIVSALRDDLDRRLPRGEILEWVCLNGRAIDGPDLVTFGRTQYAERAGSADPIMQRCASDLLTRPVVFVGTELDEPQLWQHIALRAHGENRTGEFRKKSFMVTPSLAKPKLDLLKSEFNVEHLALTAEGFAHEVLAQLAGSIDAGLLSLRASAGRGAQSGDIPRLSVLSAEGPAATPDFLLGETPQWADVQSGFAIARECDHELLGLVQQASAEGSTFRVILVGGTAGTGKSTSVMRLALTLEAQGRPVGWLDSNCDISTRTIRDRMGSESGPDVLIVDDADRFGAEGPSLVADILQRQPQPLVVLVVRSAKLGRIADGLSNQRVAHREYSIPNLTDSDIDSLIDALDRANRLGVLKGKTGAERVAAFRSSAGRQLIVAMLEATSGVPFEEKLISEYEQLESVERDIYAIACVATAISAELKRDEIVQAFERPSNDVLAGVEHLVRRRLLLSRPAGTIEARHKVIGERVLNHCSREGSLGGIVGRILRVMAMAVSSGTSREHRDYKRVRRLMNHRWLRDRIGPESAQEVLALVESLLEWDHHYWLQRGALEVEVGDLGHAENYLGQAHSLEPRDPLILTEMGYLRCSMGCRESAPARGNELYQSGVRMLKEAIEKRGRTDPHPFHIIGSQACAWGARVDLEPQAQLASVRDAIAVVEEGMRLHPADPDLKLMLEKLKRARTSLV